jgi:hypothetical protein
VAAAAAVAVSCTTLGIVLLDGSSGLAARAYAATEHGDSILHTVRTTTVERLNQGSRPSLDAASLERWQHGDDVHNVVRIPEGTLHHVLQDGRLTIVQPDGRVQRSGEGENAEVMADMVKEVRADPVADFRAAYAADGLTEAGDAVFAGRASRRFIVPDLRSQDVHGSELEQREFFLDAASGRPLGARYTRTRDATDTGEFREITTTVIERIERLEVTPQTLAELTALR